MDRDLESVPVTVPMEEDEHGAISKHKRRKVESEAAPIDCCASDVSHDGLQMRNGSKSTPLLGEASSSQWEPPPIDERLRDQYGFCDLYMGYISLKRELELYDTNWKSIIPSLALWHYMEKLEFDFDGEDASLLPKFACGLYLKDQEELKTVEEILEDKLAVKLIVYDVWSDKSKEYFFAKDHYSKISYHPPSKYDGKLIEETSDGSTTIYIGRPVFGAMAKLLWSRMSGCAVIRRFAKDLYSLLDEDLTKKDQLCWMEIRPSLGCCGGPFLEILVEMKNVMEPKYHPLIRKAQKDTLNRIWAHHRKMVMLDFHREEFPFSFFGDYSDKIREQYELKIAKSKEYGTIKSMVRQFKIMVECCKDNMEYNLESETHRAFLKNLSDGSRKIFDKMWTKASKDFKDLEEQCKKMDDFENIMEDLVEKTVTVGKFPVDLDNDIKHLDSLGLITNAENSEEHRALWEGIAFKCFQGLSVDYAILGILLFIEGSALSDDIVVAADFIRSKVKKSMNARRSYLNKIWEESCYDNEVFKDYRHPARVLSWSDGEIEFCKCDFHSHLPEYLEFELSDLKEQLEEFKIRNGDTDMPAKY